MTVMRKSQLSQHKQDRLIEHFVAMAQLAMGGKANGMNQYCFLCDVINTIYKVGSTPVLNYCCFEARKPRGVFPVSFLKAL